MVPPAISVIYCHLRWQDGSLWLWPLPDPTFFSRWQLKLEWPPLSPIRMYPWGRVAAEEKNNSWRLLLLTRWRREGGREATPWFVAPKRRETYPAAVCTHTGPPSVCLPLFCFPPFHFTSRNQNRRYMWWGKPFLLLKFRAWTQFFRAPAIWLCRPQLQG